MSLTNSRFAFLVSAVKAREAKGVTADMLEEILLRATSVAEALEFMRGTDLGEYLADLGAAKFAHIDEQLWKYLHEYFGRIKRLRSDPSVVMLIDSYLQKYDADNIVSALRAVALQKPPLMIPVGTLCENGLLDDLSRAQTYEDISAILATAGMSDYARPVRQIGDADHRSLRLTERQLDRLYVKRFVHVLEGMDDRESLLTAYGIIIDHLIMSRAIRSSASGRSGTAEGDGAVSGGYMLTPATYRELAAMKVPEIASRLEDTPYRAMVQEVGRQIEQHGIYAIDRTMEPDLVRRLRNLLSPRSISPCAVLWHLMFKEVEIRNVRLAMKAVQDGLPPAEVKDYLVVGL